MPGFARSHCHGDGTPIRPGASGTKAPADVPPGILRYPVSRLICGRASSAGSGSREPAYPASRTLAQRYGINRDTSARPRLRRPAGRRGGYGARSEYIKVRSVAYDRAGFVGTQKYRSPIRRPRKPTLRTIRACRASIGERAGDEVADRVILGDLAQLAVAEPKHARPAGEPARRRRRRTASWSARSPCPPDPRRAPSWGMQAAPASRPPVKSAKRAESPLTFAS